MGAGRHMIPYRRMARPSAAKAVENGTGSWLERLQLEPRSLADGMHPCCIPRGSSMGIGPCKQMASSIGPINLKFGFFGVPSDAA